MGARLVWAQITAHQMMINRNAVHNEDMNDFKDGGCIEILLQKIFVF
jgi:hypothetical protein